LVTNLYLYLSKILENVMANKLKEYTERYALLSQT